MLTWTVHLCPTNEDIIGSIIPTDIDEDEEDDLGDELPTVTYQEACSALLTVRAYLLHSSTNSEAPYSLIQTLEFEISKCHTSLLVQPKITDYFSRLQLYMLVLNMFYGCHA